MKSLNAKRIAAVAAGLLMGLAVAGQGVTFGNIPIINSAGQPVVQIVVGSSAMPSDGVVAANIAAAIGSLAHTTQNITATVGGRSGVSCVVTTPTCTLSNQQVWLGEKGLTVSAGSFTFTSLIGSVLNGGVINSGNLAYTKAIPNLQTDTAYQQFVYPDLGSVPNGGYAISTSPTPPSAWEGVGLSPAISVTSTNGGGMVFNKFTNQSYDEALRLTNSQLPGLLASSGTYQESETLWVAGFPVYNQSGANNFELMDPQAAYQVAFGKPIQNKTNGASTNAQFSLLGQNWTVYNMQPPATSVFPSSGNFITGGNVTLAQASTPLTTVYVGHNITSGPFTVVLNDLSYPNSNGLSDAALSIYKNGVLTNVTSAGPAQNVDITVNASGSKLFIAVPQTFPGLYAYQKWAKIQLFSNTFNVTSGKDFNEATNGHKWLTLLRWSTNQSTAPSTQKSFNANAALQGIILYTNQTQGSGLPVQLSPGQSISFITNPAVWKLNFVGDALGTPGSGNTNYDQLSFTTSSGGLLTYQNPNGDTGSQTPTSTSMSTFSNAGVVSMTAENANAINVGNVTEASNLFTVSSGLSAAFQVSPSGTFVAPTSNLQTLKYNLDGYQYAPVNTVDSAGSTNLAGINGAGLTVRLMNNGLNGNYVTNNNQLTVTVYGHKYGQTAVSSQSVSFTGFNTNQSMPNFVLANVTDVSLQTAALPYPGVTVNVYEGAWASASGANTMTVGNTILMGQLTYAGPVLLYNVPSKSNYVAPNGLSSTVTYTGENNNVQFTLSAAAPANNAARATYFTYNMPEITIPSSSTPDANAMIQITNQSSGAGTSVSPLYWLNTSVGSSSTTLQNALTYVSSQGQVVKAAQGFRTERGSEVASVSTASITYDMAKSVDGLQFVFGTAGSANSTSTTKQYGPYGVGQATNIPNVTIAKVNATCAFSTTSCTVSGLANLTAVPSVSSAVVANPLNTATTPLAVLDSGANNSSTLIVVGSKYVNSVAAQIFAQNPSFNQAFGPTGSDSVVVQAFGTNRILVAGYSAGQTVQAGNEFIQALLANAGT